MKKGSSFNTARSQAIRPESLAPRDNVSCVDSIASVAAGEEWDSWFNSPASSDDFIIDRTQPEPKKRDDF